MVRFSPAFFALLAMLAPLAAGPEDGKGGSFLIESARPLPDEIRRALPQDWPRAVAPALRGDLSDADLAKELDLQLSVMAFRYKAFFGPEGRCRVWLEIEQGEVGDPPLKRRLPEAGDEFVIESPGRVGLALCRRYSPRMLKFLEKAGKKPDTSESEAVELELWHISSDHWASEHRRLGPLWFGMKEKTIKVDAAKLTRWGPGAETVLLNMEATEKRTDGKTPWRVRLTLKASPAPVKEGAR